jgi:hypothetical protein
MTFTTAKLFYPGGIPICSTVLPISSIVSIIGLFETNNIAGYILDPTYIILSMVWLSDKAAKYEYCEYLMVDAYVKKYVVYRYTPSLDEIYRIGRTMYIVTGEY